MLSDTARAQNEKELQRLQRELQGMQEDAQPEQQEMTAQLQAEFQNKLNPIIDQVATEKGLHVVFDATGAGMVWANTGLDITAEVIKRFDAAMRSRPRRRSSDHQHPGGGRTPLLPVSVTARRRGDGTRAGPPHGGGQERHRSTKTSSRAISPAPR